ncbi:cadherin-like domain-containing protein [Psychrobium sp. MM17-31]|uniref:cadherin-like domain-containing protein n=1 Tax=Psychrobium sp. MM17-31 TaxID=2917758 RepID=UPI001EF64638|nr:cadherin-like domain-containing protein [Psychrobium sp. MM17-31]MCG7530365.1 cadherin-like domain-containing protein [Psychrobium sp. MM17-31]
MKNTFKLLPVAAAVATLTACGGSSSNSVPEFSQSSYTLSVQEDASGKLTATATDANNSDVLSYSLGNAPANGTVEVAANGELTYTPDANFNGQDTFSVSVSDGKATVSAQVTVTVENVNDAPTIDSEKLVLTGGETKTATVDAQDIDGDTLTYSVVTEPTKGTLTLDSATGAITYTPNELSVVNDSVEVKVSDGNGGEVTETLALSSSAASNADRAYYYYADDSSRLERAETVVTALEDDLNQGDVFTALANGYAAAGLSKEVDRLTSDEKIVRDEQRAGAYVGVANNYQGQDEAKQAKAAELRDQALALYGEYVATKGTSSFNRDDVSFYNDISDSYFKAGNAEKATNAFSVLDVLFENGADKPYETHVLQAYFGYRGIINDAIEQWQNNPTDENYNLAVRHVDRLHGYANQVGHRLVSNDRNGNLGKIYHSVRNTALEAVVESYRVLGENEKAKTALADALALYGVVNYDSEYPRTAADSAPVTAVEYPYGMVSVADDIVHLYPDFDIKLLTDKAATDFYKEWITDDANETKLLANVSNAATKEDALALLEAAKNEENLRAHFTSTVAFSRVGTKGAAILYREKQQYDNAVFMLGKGIEIIGSDAYLAQNVEQQFVTGSTGCQMVLEEYELITSRTQSQAHIDAMQASFTTCSNIALTKYNNGINDTDIEVSDAIYAQATMLYFAQTLNDKEAIAKHVAVIEENFQKAREIESDAILFTKVGESYYKAKDYVKAQGMYNRALELVRKVETNAAEQDKGTVTAKYFNSGSVSTNYLGFVNAIRREMGVNPDAPAALAAATKTWHDFIKVNMTDLEDSALQFKLNFLPKYAAQLTSLGKFDDAFAIASNEALGTVEKDAINAATASAMSTWDDFTRTNIASVDTDKDGKPNFFAAFATQAMIDASGLTLDEDSDNDGVNDDVDGFPLDSTKQ